MLGYRVGVESGRIGDCRGLYNGMVYALGWFWGECKEFVKDFSPLKLRAFLSLYISMMEGLTEMLERMHKKCAIEDNSCSIAGSVIADELKKVERKCKKN